MATVIVEVAGSADVADRRMQLLIAEPALMFLASLQPGACYHATKSDQGADQASQ
jgi:hypothetical protein